MKHYLDLQEHSDRCQKYPELPKLGVKTLMALHALLGGQEETAVLRNKCDPGQKTFLSTHSVLILEDKGIINAFTAPTKKPRNGAGMVTFIELTPQGQELISGLFVTTDNLTATKIG